MKANIRKGAFETNSSSTHSIMIQSNYPRSRSGAGRWTFEEGLRQLEAMGVKVGWGFEGAGGKRTDMSLDFGGIDPELAEFGRTEEAYNTFGMKLLYAIVSFKPDAFLWGALLGYLHESFGIDTIYLKNAYGQFAGNDGSEFGYVDHDSVDALAKIFGEGITFDGYLFRKDVYIMIDNEG